MKIEDWHIRHIRRRRWMTLAVQSLAEPRSDLKVNLYIPRSNAVHHDILVVVGFVAEVLTTPRDSTDARVQRGIRRDERV